MTKPHTHPRTDELHVFYMPADPAEPMEMKVIYNDWRSMGKLVDGYITLVISREIPDLRCGCSAVLVVNEEGMLRKMMPNNRVTGYSQHVLVGNTFLVGSTGEEFFSLPPEFHNWKGPGHPYPDPAQPWEK